MIPENDSIPISNRRRWLLVFLPAIISTAGLIALFLFQRQLTPSWQLAMENYQSMQADQGNTFEVLSVVTALLPGEFDAEEPFRPPRLATNLQYPADEVRCVEAKSVSDGGRQIFLLVRHDPEASEEGWLIYEATGNADEVNRTLAEIGCFLPSFEEE